MASTGQQQLLDDYGDDLDDYLTDEASTASLETDDGQDHPPERILAQVKAKNDFTWYLVKWQDCPVLRSSWEGKSLFNDYPWVLDAWFAEQGRQALGLSKPLDLDFFDKAVAEAEKAAQRRRVLRRLKRRISRLISISTQEQCGRLLSTSFQPTKDFQIIREGQDLPPGLHVRLNIYTGEREARLNIPMEGEEGYNLEGLPTEQSVVIIDQPEAEPGQPAMRDQVTIKPPAYQDAGKIPPPIPDPEAGDEMGTFQKALLTVKMEARALDSALDDLSELSHDIYYGVEIAKDGPVLEKLVCLTLGAGSEKMPATEKERDHKAASILASSIQNNPTALKEVSGFWKSVLYPTCGFDAAANTQRNFVSMLRSRLGREKEPSTLKAKVSAISGLLRDPIIRDEFLEKGGMELLLAIFLKKGEQFDVVRRKVGQLVMDNFLDEGMGAAMGIWPKQPVSETKTCESKESMLGDGCWEHHVGAFSKSNTKATWAKDFLAALKEQRQDKVNSTKDREL